jgi:hypothetical protein
MGRIADEMERIAREASLLPKPGTAAEEVRYEIARKDFDDYLERLKKQRSMVKQSLTDVSSPGLGADTAVTNMRDELRRLQESKVPFGTMTPLNWLRHTRLELEIER